MKETLPYYAVERAFFRAAARLRPNTCPVCTKQGRWEGDYFVPTNERQPKYPPCKCATLHRAKATGPGEAGEAGEAVGRD